MADSLTLARESRTAKCVLLLMACTIVPILISAAFDSIGSDGATFLFTVPLFVGASMHVASTGWFYSVPEVRTHMRAHRLRYLVIPVLLVAGGAGVVSLLTDRATHWLLLGFLAWQFVHFQKQNLGVTALVARARRVATPSRIERRALTLAGIGGVTGLLGHPSLLQVDVGGSSDFLVISGTAVFAAAVVLGVVCLMRRERDPDYAVVYLMALLFFVPVFLFDSPYAAVAGLTIAHGLQYLALMTMVASGSRDRTVSLLVLLNVALFAGLGLNAMSHAHGNGAGGQALFGAFLGLSMAHFVIDGGLWRLRDEFPRTFLRERLPYLLVTS